ncbi:hypothetical protein CLOSYM_01705 [[Clostridium] symbiosum ATCC 14940]|uniref:Uncharacterized protein n=1 Tax=[Clostridium] symbiosum ATCC 14940 TaxID=411472 RepID=A0ABC9TZM9_CLOSY|nr:hypothetical protein CLOSYM_01705 [[Clostridium] symbiosum ATCC 14940]
MAGVLLIIRCRSIIFKPLFLHIFHLLFQFGRQFHSGPFRNFQHDMDPF